MINLKKQDKLDKFISPDEGLYERNMYTTKHNPIYLTENQLKLPYHSDHNKRLGVSTMLKPLVPIV